MASQSGIALSIRPQGIEALNAALSQMKRRDLKPALNDIGMSMVVATQRRFETETDPLGRPWRPLSAVTLAARAGGRLYIKSGKRLTAKAAKVINSGRILRDSARLYQSITHAVSGQGVEIGSNLVYARIHQMGGQAGRGKKVTIPARPFLGLSKTDTQTCADVLAGYLLTGRRA
ncbi:MAG: phage virion morphogenesis protein [Alphaproteobacteria bacterium]|nr:phage virion morphogenesis protein [Alphaproteobacteria bacterium]